MHRLKVDAFRRMSSQALGNLGAAHGCMVQRQRGVRDELLVLGLGALGKGTQCRQSADQQFPGLGHLIGAALETVHLCVAQDPLPLFGSGLGVEAAPVVQANPLRDIIEVDGVLGCEGLGLRSHFFSPENGDGSTPMVVPIGWMMMLRVAIRSGDRGPR